MQTGHKAAVDFGGRYHRCGRRDRAVWAALNDTEVLKAGIPGCKRIDWTADNTLELEITVNLGIVHPVFAGDLRLSDIDPGRALHAHRTRARRAAGHGAGVGRYRARPICGRGTLLVFARHGRRRSGQIMKLGRR